MVDRRWHGWRPLPPAEPVRGVGPWVDLSHPLRSELRTIPAFPEARFERIHAMPAHPYNLTELQMVCHFGTHVDAPCHFIPDGPAFHEIPLERLCGAGVVLRMEAEPYDVITADALAAVTPEVRDGDIVILDTGWAEYVGTKRYDEHPRLDVEAAEWLVEHGAKLVAVDWPTPDLAVNRRPEGFDWPVHHVLLGHGVLIAENLTNLAAITGRRVEAMFLALNVVAGDGAPTRAVARATEPN
jgi:kynurenine formamidase